MTYFKLEHEYLYKNGQIIVVIELIYYLPHQIIACGSCMARGVNIEDRESEIINVRRFVILIVFLKYWKDND